jgi:hypothetical protein
MGAGIAKEMLMPANPLQKQVERDQLGRFEKGRSGNPTGRVAGVRNRATYSAELLLDGEAEALTRKAVELALGGDSSALRLCLERIIAPRRERSVQIALPAIRSAADLAGAMAAITAAVAGGEITPGEAIELAQVVETFVRAFATSDYERWRSRLAEEAHAAKS